MTVKKQPHILHVNLASGFRGGERQTALLIQQLAQYPCQQSLLVRYTSPLKAMLKSQPKLQIIDIKKPFLVSALLRQFHKKPDFLHAHEAKAAHWCYVYYLRSKTPYCLVRRIMTPPKKNKLTRYVYSSARQIFALSNAIKDALIAWEQQCSLAEKTIIIIVTNEKIINWI